MKKYLFAISTLTSFYLNAQNGSVGINTESPKATLHVLGSPTDTSKLDGIIAPIITGDELAAKTYGSDQTGAILYVTASATNKTGQVINVSKIGYYYFNGSEWIPLNSEEKDTLEYVMLRGNYAPKKIDFETTSNPFSLYYKNNNFFASNSYNDSSTGTNNILFGQNTGKNFSTASRNLLFGNSAANYLTTGSYNSIFGYNAAYALNVGIENSIFGYLAGQGDVNGSAYSYSTFLGARAGFKSLNGKYNTFSGYSSGYNNTIGDFNTFSGTYSGFNNISGFFNSFYGGLTGHIIKNGNSNVIFGYGAGGSKNQTPTQSSNRNIYIGRLAGTGVQGDNNIFIGTQAGFVPGTGTLGVYNNKLIIHNRNGFVDDETSATATTNAEDTFTTGLILGDFAERWVKFNGTFSINPSYLNSDTSFTKNVVAKPDGTIGLENKISIPTPPTTGNYILKSINGVLTWIAE